MPRVYYGYGFAVVDDVTCLDDELFGICPEQIEGVRAYLLQDGHDDTACQPSGFH